MEILEGVVYSYYTYSKLILWVVGVIFGLIVVIDVCMLKENKSFVLNKILHDLFYSGMIVCFGTMYFMLGLAPKIKYIHFNVTIFLLLMILVLLYGILQWIVFKKIKITMLQICKYIKYIVFFELFLLTITRHLEIYEWITGTLVILCMETLLMLIEKYTNREQKEILKESDYPNPDLFYTREKQLEKFISILEQQKIEPYAVMISGEWGTGKSSFVKALEKKLKSDAFIWIYAGSEKSVTEIMLEISGKIIKVLKQNNIFIEKEGLIERYFMAFANLLEGTKIKFFNKIISIFDSDGEQDTKEYLNNKLQDLTKTIYLIIDDLDRCSDEYQEKMFKVVRESTELVHCKTIFLVDKDQFMNHSNHYIEKYISYTLDLCKVEHTEIFSYLIDDIIKDDFVLRMNEILLKNRNIEDTKKLICQFPEKILGDLGIEITKASDSVKDKKNKETERKKYEAKVADITQTVSKIKKNITNARKVKNYLKGIRRDIENVNVEISNCSVELQKEDWLQYIVAVQFLKNMLPELYGEIKMSDNISEFDRNYKGYSAEIILGLKYGFLIFEENKEMILNHIIYKVDVIDFLKIQSEKERYIKELYSERAVLANITEYLNYATTYNDFMKILELCEKQEFDNGEEREQFIKNILKTMSKQFIEYKIENQLFYEMSIKIIDCIKRFELSEREKNICVQEGYMITRKILVNNSHILRNILLVFFKVSEVEMAWQTLSVTDISEFYTMLKRIDANFIDEGMEIETEKLKAIRKYYDCLMEELKKEEYNESGLDWNKVSVELGIIFDNCQLWLDIEHTLNDSCHCEDIQEVNMYFYLDGVYSSKENTFSNISSLKHALNSLEKFYELKTEDYKTEFSLLLLRLSHQIVLMYESNPAWFEGNEKEVCTLLNQLSNQICALHASENIYDKSVIDQMKVFVYKFSCYCKDE